VEYLSDCMGKLLCEQQWLRECLWNWTYGNCDLLEAHVRDKTNLYLGRVVNKQNSTGGIGVYLLCFVLSGRVLCDDLITRPEEVYRMWCVSV
jgi:hypothetical protein